MLNNVTVLWRKDFVKNRFISVPAYDNGPLEATALQATKDLAHINS